MRYEALENEICAWAKEQEDVRGLVVIGSRARNDHPANEWSDLDLILFVTDPQRFTADFSWLSVFGKTWLEVNKSTGIGDPEWLVIFEGGFKVDFLLAKVTGSLDDMLFGSKYLFVTRRGVRVLLNKLGDVDLSAFKSTNDSDWHRPLESDFSAVINKFWLSAYRATTILKSGDLWRTRMIIASELHSFLLILLKWQAKAVKGAKHDTWYDGRYIEEWVDPQFKAQLPLIFAPYNKADTSRALLQIVDLGSRLGEETAQIWHYHYPASNTRHLHDWIVTSLDI
ncbi:MAG: aminoglycoside 6-adenylyltransferase [Candidatus Promineifilaceae bacterium]|nr:aminoglycoside 6-adenylyltransferase [Candidatus Promineifilaceae bacterium]